MAEVTAAEVARLIDVPPDDAEALGAVRASCRCATGDWSPPAIAQARIVARLRERGHTMAPDPRGRRRAGGSPTATSSSCSRAGTAPHSLERRRRAHGPRAGADRAHLDARSGSPPPRATGSPTPTSTCSSTRAAVLQAGFPLVAFLQLIRVYGQALTQIADAEVKLFHLYVHEPLMRDGVPGLEMAEEMEGLAADLLPLAAPMMDGLHRRLLRHFVEQDVVGHMEAEADFDLGRLRVAIAFADLAGYTRLTEQAGEEQALDVVERFVAGVEATLPDDARVIKTIGDEVDDRRRRTPAALVDWAVGYQRLGGERAAAAADRDPRRRRAVPRRRLLRPRGQPRLARRGARGRRRGAGDAPGRRGRRPAPDASTRSARSR